MSDTNENHAQADPAAGPGSIGDQNIERLLGRAYQPEPIREDFAARVTAQMVAVAGEEAQKRNRRARPFVPAALCWAGAAAAAAIAVGLLLTGLPGDRPVERPTIREARTEYPGPAPAARPGRDAAPQDPLANGMRPRPRPASPPAKPMGVGSTVRTGPRQRRRVTLADGSVLYVDRDTTLEVTGPRGLTLRTGQVYAEVSPAGRAEGRSAFAIRTPDREVVALGTRVAVRVRRGRTGVLVTQGKVRVSGLDRLLYAGQQLRPDGGRQKVEPLPRASHVLDWTKDLMAAAQSPLVPKSKYAGGALVAVDPNGQEMNLSLRKFHVDVHIEDGFARTTIDQTYFNHTTRRLEGTFYFPLPPDASLSRLAMYVNGTLNEGGMVERSRARQVYESIVSKMKDPALLEWIDGTTFKMRVFPLEGRREKRIILSYTQRLGSLYGRTTYRFPAGHTMTNVGKWSFRARLKSAADIGWSSGSHSLAPTPDGDDLLLDSAAENVKPDTDVVLDLSDDSRQAEDAETARFSSAEYEGHKYLMLRYRPELPGRERKAKRHWVFLFERSADRDPLLARTQIEIIRGILENAEHDDTFAVVTAGTRTATLADQPLTASRKNIKAAIEFLGSVHLVGALDLEGGLSAAAERLRNRRNPHLVHLGSALPVLGARRQDRLLACLPPDATYVGVGVGKRWNRGFMKAAAARTGGYFTQINPDEQISWRAFELVSTLNTPRLLGVRVVGDPSRASGPNGGGQTFLCHNDSVAQGEELCAIRRLAKAAKLPKLVTVRGVLGGKPWEITLAVRKVAPKAGYLPRTWTRLEIDRLLAEDAAKNHPTIVRLSKAMYVMSPYTSLLVLENEQMYKRHKVDRGRKDHWALYPCPAKIPVVHEPLRPRPGDKKKKPDAKTKPKPKDPWQQKILQTILVRMPAAFFQPADWRQSAPKKIHHYSYALTAWQFYTGAYGVPIITLWNGQNAYHIGAVIDRSGWMGGTFNTVRTGLSGVRTVVAVPDGGTLLIGGQMSGGELEGKMGVPLLNKMPILNRLFSNRGKVRDESTLLILIKPKIIIQQEEEAKALRRVLELNPRNVEALTQLATALRRLGRYADATELLGRVLQLDPRNKWAAEWKQYLQTETDLRLERRLLTKRQGELRQLLDVRDAEIPWWDILRYPSDWKEITAKAQLAFIPDRGWRYLPGQTATLSWRGTQTNRNSPFLYVPVFTDNRGTVWNVQAWNTRAPATLSVSYPLGQPVRVQITDAGVASTYAVWDHRPSTVAEVAFSPDGRFVLIAPGGDRVPFTPNDVVNWEIRDDITNFLPAYRLADPRVVVNTRFLNVNLASPDVLAKYPLGRLRLSYAFGLNTNSAGADVLAYLPWPGRRWVAPPERGLPYQRPTFTGHRGYFDNLTLYAPGLNATATDILAVLEAEAPGDARPKQGRIDPAARKLIDAARAAGWQALTFDAGAGKDAPLVFFDGAGRYVYRRRLTGGLVENVICDGSALLHLYPEIGLGARRQVGRFHRAALPAAVPWLLPPAEDLAVEMDVTSTDGHTVVLTPRGRAEADSRDAKTPTHYGVQLVFAKDATLAERRLVAMPGSKTILRWTFAADGTVRAFDEDSKLLTEHKYNVRPCPAPDLKPDLSDLVVLPMPMRTRDHVLKTRKLDLKKIASWSEADALAYIAATPLGLPGGSQGKDVIEKRFIAKGDDRLGFRVLLQAKGYWAALGDGLRDRPLARYIAAGKALDKAGRVDPLRELAEAGDGFIHRLAGFRYYWRQVSRPKPKTQGPAARRGESPVETDARKAMQAAVLKYAERIGPSVFAWALLSQLARPGCEADFHGKLAAAFERHKELGGLAYAARYEAARSLYLYKAGTPQARERFKKLYAESARGGCLPAFDKDFRTVLAGHGWEELIRRTARTLVEKRARFAAVVLAWQCHEVGDAKIGAEVIEMALHQAPEPLRLPLRLAAFRYYRRAKQWARADGVAAKLLENEGLTDVPQLWRVAAEVAAKCGRTAAAARRLDKAVGLEYRELPEKVDVRWARQRCGELLGRYQEWAKTIAAQKSPPPKEALAGIIRGADRWRALDVDPTAACQAAAKALRPLGASELAWEYLTTPLAAKPNEAGPWVKLAASLRSSEDGELADRAYAAAAEIDPANPQILWDRAELLRQRGKTPHARRLYRRIADGTWAAKYRPVQRRAKIALKK